MVCTQTLAEKLNQICLCTMSLRIYSFMSDMCAIKSNSKKYKYICIYIYRYIDRYTQ